MYNRIGLVDGKFQERGWIQKETEMKRIIPPDMVQILKKEFSGLSDEVNIKLITRKGENDKFSEFAAGLLRELSDIFPLIRVEFLDENSDEAEVRKDILSPILLISPEKYRIEFFGTPMGEEGRSLISAIVMASLGKGMLKDSSVSRLSELDKEREMLVFVSPTCPYCPQQVIYAVSAAIERPERISVKVVEIYEQRALAEQYHVGSVPQTVINGNITSIGSQPEEVFIDSLFSGAPVEMKLSEPKDEVIKRDILVIGAGPAGLTAAIYTERAGLKTVVLEKGNIGGQVALTPVVENYPGYTRIPGKTLMDMMAQQALQYTEIIQGEEVLEIEKKADIFTVRTTSNRYEVRGVIIATGAKHRKLGVSGEERLFGRGVSYCATCDGYFFKDGKRVIMVGGGNSAVTEALYLESIGVDVTLVHRRDTLRAEKRLRDNLMERKIPLLLNTVVEEIMGKEVVKGVRLKDVKEDRSYTMDLDGVFIAIGYEPVNEVAKKLGLELAPDGYIKVDERQRTSMPGVYAAGDVTGGIKQIVTAVGQGSVAALTAFEDLTSPYWKGKGDMF